MPNLIISFTKARNDLSVFPRLDWLVVSGAEKPPSHTSQYEVRLRGQNVFQQKIDRKVLKPDRYFLESYVHIDQFMDDNSMN